jgi:hypothetical protein
MVEYSVYPHPLDNLIRVAKRSTDWKTGGRSVIGEIFNITLQFQPFYNYESRDLMAK